MKRVILFLLLAVAWSSAGAQSLIDQRSQRSPSGDAVREGYAAFHSFVTEATGTAIDTLTGNVAQMRANATSASFSIAGVEAVAFGLQTTTLVATGTEGIQLRYRWSVGDSTAWSPWAQALTTATASIDTAVSLTTVPNGAQMQLHIRQWGTANTTRTAYRVRVYVLHGQ